MKSQRKAMEIAVLVCTLIHLPACGIRNYIPQGHCLSGSAQEAWLMEERTPVTYTGGPRVPFPVPPFQVFALHYQEVFVLEARNPDWSMQEFARVSFGGEPVWLVNQSDPAGLQTVTADLADIRQWFPEIPVPRSRSPIAVQDRSTPTRLDVSLGYTDPAGHPVDVRLESPIPPAQIRKRNGSTFTHSAQALCAVLDIPARQERGVEAAIFFDGRPAKIRRVLGLFPVKALLVQTQAGFAVASMRVTQPAPGEMMVERPIPGTPWPSESLEVWKVLADRLSYRRPTGSWDYLLRDGGVSGALAGQAGIPEPLLRVLLSAPLPDLRRPFEGRVARNFVLLINGQAHGYGRMTAWSQGDEAFLDIVPVAPRWLAERPLRTRIFFNDRTADLVTTRIRPD